MSSSTRVHGPKTINRDARLGNIKHGWGATARGVNRQGRAQATDIRRKELSPLSGVAIHVAVMNQTRD